MSENLKTIRELADEFNVSKQAVRKRLTDEFRANYVETVHSNGVKTLVVTVTGYILLKQHFSGGNSDVKVASNVGGNDGNLDVASDSKKNDDEVSVLKILEQQLAVKDQQQRLALQDKQLLEEYKAEIKDLKALTMAPHDGGEKEVTLEKKPAPDIRTSDSQVKTKKWWHFGR